MNVMVKASSVGESIQPSMSSDLSDDELSSVSSFESDESYQMAQREWEESVQQLQQLVSIVLLPMLGKFLGRRTSMWGKQIALERETVFNRHFFSVWALSSSRTREGFLLGILNTYLEWSLPDFAVPLILFTICTMPAFNFNPEAFKSPTRLDACVNSPRRNNPASKTYHVRSVNGTLCATISR